MYEVEIVRELNLDKSCIKIDSSFIVGTLLIKNIISLENFIKVNNKKKDNYRDYLCIDIVNDELVYKIVDKEPDGYNVFTIRDDGSINLNTSVPYNKITKLTDAISKDIESEKEVKYEEYLKLTTFSLEVVEHVHKTLLAKKWVSEYVQTKDSIIAKDVIDYDKIGIPKDYIYKEYYLEENSRLLRYIDEIAKHTRFENISSSVMYICRAFSKLCSFLPEKRFYSNKLRYTNNTFSKGVLDKIYVNYEEKFITETIRVYENYSSANEYIKVIINPILDCLLKHRHTERSNLTVIITKFILDIVNNLDFIDITTKQGKSIKMLTYDFLLMHVDNKVMDTVANRVSGGRLPDRGDDSYIILVGNMYIAMDSISKMLFKGDVISIDTLKHHSLESDILKSFLDTLELKIEIKD